MCACVTPILSFLEFLGFRIFGVWEKVEEVE